MNSNNAVAVVIVTWNGLEHLRVCLPALYQQSYLDFKIILVDNGSEDGTPDYVRAEYPEVELIALPVNQGFAGPNNLGFNKALADPETRYIVALNNDTKPEPTYLEELVACAERHPDAGSVQAKVINFFDPDRLDSTGILIAREMSAINRAQKEPDDGRYDLEEEIFGPSASASLYTREALGRVMLPFGSERQEYFDSSYFAYYEDVDLAWRLRLAGFSSYYTPLARVYHVHSATGKNYSPFKAFHIHRNHFYNIIKNLPLPFLLSMIALVPVRYVLLLCSVFKKQGASAELSSNVKKGESGLVKIVIRSWLEVLRNLPHLLRKRKYIQGKRRVSLQEINRWFVEYRADYKKIIFG